MWFRIYFSSLNLIFKLLETLFEEEQFIMVFLSKTYDILVLLFSATNVQIPRNPLWKAQFIIIFLDANIQHNQKVIKIYFTLLMLQAINKKKMGWRWHVILFLI